MLIENPPKGKKLIDRTGRVLPLVENELLNSYPIYMADKIEDIKNTGVREAKLLFTIESAHEVKEIIYAYKNASESKKEFTRGKFYKGV